jgi:hypothetical protein
MPAPTTAMWRCELAFTEAGRALGRDLGGISFLLCEMKVVEKAGSRTLSLQRP